MAGMLEGKGATVLLDWRIECSGLPLVKAGGKTLPVQYRIYILSVWVASDTITHLRLEWKGREWRIG